MERDRSSMPLNSVTINLMPFALNDLAFKKKIKGEDVTLSIRTVLKH